MFCRLVFDIAAGTPPLWRGAVTVGETAHVGNLVGTGATFPVAMRVHNTTIIQSREGKELTRGNFVTDDTFQAACIGPRCLTSRVGHAKQLTEVQQ